MNAKDFVDSTISQNRIVLFGTTICPYTARSKELLLKDYSAVPVKEIHLDTLRESRGVRDYLVSITGHTAIPRIFVNNLHIGGADESENVHREGRLRTMLAEGGISNGPL